MRKTGSIALALFLGAATPAFMAQSASAQEAPQQGGPACAPGFSMDPACGPAPYVFGAIGAAFLVGLIVLLSQNHHHTQVSP